MKLKFTLPAICMIVLMVSGAVAQVPLVFDIENRGSGCSVSPGGLSNNPGFPNPFEFTGGGTVSSFDDWTCRRNEIKADIQQYEIGVKPAPPSNITASYSGGTLTVTVNENGQTVTLTSNFSIPSGNGPHPIIIGMNSGTGSLSSSLFSGIVQVPFIHNQVTTYNGKSSNDPFYRMYPGLTANGQYSAWSWGVSRLIDGLEIVADQLNLDMSRIGVSGCSYAGKMALFAGAFDERIALTIAQESGGGGINSWRTSQDFTNRTGINVEKINNTNGSWFMQSMLGQNPYNLPHDHHELIAMIAPRAFVTLGNPTFGDWLGDESGFKSCMAALEVWKAMGVEDRFGFDFTGGHNHCQAATSQNNSVTAFVNKFLRNNTNVNTTIRIQPTRTDFDYNWQSYVNWSTPVISIEDPTPQSPFNGTPHSIPGTIQAEEFDLGSSGLAYFDDTPGTESGVNFRAETNVDFEESTDVGGGYNIGWFTADEWLEYTLDVANTGTYDIDLRVACNGDGRIANIEMNDNVVAGDITIPNTGGWQTWTTVTVEDVSLNAGEQVMRISLGDVDYINLNYVSFTATSIVENTDIWLEAECGAVGSLWNTTADATASNGDYVTVQAGNNSTASAPSDASGHITFNVDLSDADDYTLWARVIAPTPTDDSYWIQVDGGTWMMWNNIAPGSTSWTWDDIDTYSLGSGSHMITIAYREDGAQLDKLYITNSGTTPAGVGGASSGCSVNEPPVANAGSDQTVIDDDGNGGETTTLDGTASSDPDGTIASYVWMEGGNQIATGANPSLSLALGVHTITLTVTDNDGATATDNVVITVEEAPNQVPVANAGTDQTVIDDDGNGGETTTLDGTGSSDPDGTIASYIWTEGGNQIATGANPSLSLVLGVHTITLTVTDDDGATDTDNVTITVEEAPNQAPLANAGSDQTVTDTDNSGSETVVLNGSASNDPDGTISSYVWIESGNQIATGVNPSVSFSVGTHDVTLTVTDDDGATDIDNVIIMVNPGPTGSTGVWLEGECGTVGSLWNTNTDAAASNGDYVTIQSGNNSTANAPTGSASQISFSFDVAESGDYSLWARVIMPSPTDDSYWVQIDGGAWYLWNNVGPFTNWTWEEVQSYTLSAGTHTLAIAYREDGAQLDKLYITNQGDTPTGLGGSADNCNEPPVANAGC